MSRLAWIFAGFFWVSIGFERYIFLFFFFFFFVEILVLFFME